MVLTVPSIFCWHLLHCYLLLLRKPRQQFRYIAASLTNEFLNIQKKMPIVMGAVLLNWNNSVLLGSAWGRVVCPALIHLSRAPVCSHSPGEWVAQDQAHSLTLRLSTVFVFFRQSIHWNASHALLDSTLMRSNTIWQLPIWNHKNNEWIS